MVKHMEPGATRFFANAIHEFAQSLGKENFYVIGEVTGGRSRAVTTPPCGIAHAFNGSEQQAHTFIKLGMHLGFGGAMTFTRALQIRRLAAGLPLGRIGEPHEIAGAAVFLASPSGGFMTGQSIVIDGGRVVGGATVDE